MVRHEANAEHADQNQHVPAGLCQLIGVGGRRLIPLRQQQPARGGGVEEDQGQKDQQEDDQQAGVDDLVDQVELLALQDVTAHHTGETVPGVLVEEGQDHVGAGRNQEEPPGDGGHYVGGPRRLQSIVSHRIDNLQVPAERRDVRWFCSDQH